MTVCPFRRAFLKIDRRVNVSDYCSNGPVSTLPGHSSLAEGSEQCEYCKAPAAKKIQTCTDSFGCEYALVCDEHAAQVRREMNAPRSFDCDWCKKETHGSPISIRDIDEGSCGPVYEVCSPCRDRYNKRLQEEMERDYW